MAGWLESELDRQASAKPNPGRTEALHRLSRTEYKNVVRDVLGLEIDVENLLPPDPLGGGDANFDNIASSLRMSQALLERYITVARRVSRTALSGATPASIQTFKTPQGLRQDIRLQGMPFGSRGGLTAVTTADGRFTAMMPHPERVQRHAQMSWTPGDVAAPSPWMRMFRNARRWVG